MNKIKAYINKHRIKSGVAFLILIYISYLGYGKYTDTTMITRYTTAIAEKGTIVSSITGSGQVSALNQIDIKSKVSGDVSYIPLENGRSIEAGTLVLKLDTRNIEKAVRDAETNLLTAKLSLEKIQRPADTLSLIQAESALTNAKQAKTRADDDLLKAYDDSFSNIGNAFIDLSPVITGIQDILYKNTNNAGQDNISYYTDLVKNYDNSVFVYRDSAAKDYQIARTTYDKTFLKYKTITRDADRNSIEEILSDTTLMARVMAESVKSTSNFLSFVKDRLTERNNTLPSQILSNQTNIDSYTIKTNQNLGNLVGNVNTIKNSKNNIQNSISTIAEKTESLAKIKNGSDELDIRSAKNSVQQKENALEDAKSNLADYYIRAPFDGTITKIAIKQTDSINNGTTIATLITKQKLAVISLNEVDVSKIKIGDKATITFDAIDSLTLSAKVTEIDTIGTVSQGVVTYNVKLIFDIQDERVKASMSVSAAIITDIKPDILAVPNSAVKSANNNRYVELFEKTMVRGTDGLGTPSIILPKRQRVEVGISNDTLTEILSGVKEGDNVVTRTVSPNKAVGASTAPNIFGATGGGNRGGGGGGLRGLGR